MNNYLMYNNTTGEACWTGITNDNIEGQNTDTHTAVMVEDCFGIDVATVFVADGIVEQKPTQLTAQQQTQITANATDTTTLTNLPDPCTITYTGPGFELTNEVTGGTAEFTTDVTGTHTVKVVAFPYLDWEGTFNAI